MCVKIFFYVYNACLMELLNVYAMILIMDLSFSCRTKMEPKKRQRAGKEAMTDQPNEPQTVTWTTKERQAHKQFERVKVNPTKFSDKFLLRQMGLLEGVEDLLQHMGMACWKDMYYQTFPEETKDFLSKVKVEYKKSKEKLASEGLMTFKIQDIGYEITIAEICEDYGFRNGEAVQFDTFHGASDLWDTITHRHYRSNKAKMTIIKNPVTRYVCKLLANTFFARRDTGAVTLKELCLV